MMMSLYYEIVSTMGGTNFGGGYVQTNLIIYLFIGFHNDFLTPDGSRKPFKKRDIMQQQEKKACSHIFATVSINVP